MLGAAAAAARRIRLLAVTLLTHLDEGALEELDLAGESRLRARSWARLARDAGCAGAVCSPLEVAALREVTPRPFLLVTPGIRFGEGSAGVGLDDQRRVATPRAALAAGADLLVVGRPLTRAVEPGRALAALEEALRLES
jgi:orotidine-5'-phosphate decarboxylase